MQYWIISQNNWHAFVWHKQLPLYQLWVKVVVIRSYFPCTNFEWNRLSQVWVMAYEMIMECKQYGHLVAMFKHMLLKHKLIWMLYKWINSVEMYWFHICNVIKWSPVVILDCFTKQIYMHIYGEQGAITNQIWTI